MVFKNVGSTEACTPNMKKVLVFQGLINGDGYLAERELNLTFSVEINMDGDNLT